MSGSSTAPTFDDLVERTQGLQPWRKLFHAVNGVTVVTVIALLDLSPGAAGAILGGIALALGALDAVRLLNRKGNELFFRLFRRLASPREASGVASSTWYAAGIALAVALFPLENATSAILVLALADPAASVVGQVWGSRPFMGGTVLGSMTFFLVAAVTLGAWHPLGVALAAALAVTLIERRSWPLDDNFTVPIACAAVTTLLGSALI